MSILFDDASSEYIKSSSYPADPGTDDITAACWIKADDFSHITDGYDIAVIMQQEDGTGTGRTWLDAYNTAGTIELVANIGTANLHGSALSAGLWYHVAFTFQQASPDALKLYLNGALDASTTTTGEACDGLLRVGAHKAPSAVLNYWSGWIEDVRVYQRVLTTQEISALAAGHRGPLGGETMWWSMAEARGVSGGFDGASLANNTNYLPDLSGNGNDGNPVNTPLGAASDAPRYGVNV